MSGRLPDFLIVGAMKSGTTSLARYLGDHPDVYVVPEKELRFFDRHFDEGIDWYRARFAAAPAGARLAGEATPTYLADAHAPERIAAVLPQARLIAMLREPADRAYSHYWHWHARMGETRSFAEVVEAELARPAVIDAGTWDPERPERYSYLAAGRYAAQLERLCAEHLHVVLFEELEADPVGTFRAACEFLGIPPDPVPESVGSVANPHSVYYPEWLWALFVRVRIGRFLPARAGGWLYRRMVRPADPYPPMPGALRDRLREHYAPENARLERRLGRPLPSGWSR